MRNKHRLRIWVKFTVFAISALIAGCSAATPTAMPGPAMAAMADMPAEVHSASARVQQAYQYAAANPDIVKQLPCYCGCAQFGHTTNYMCYVKAVDAAGKAEYDTHAVGCLICVDITQDAMRMHKAGKSISDMKAYIDATYSKYGPTNMSD